MEKEKEKEKMIRNAIEVRGTKKADDGLSDFLSDTFSPLGVVSKILSIARDVLLIILISKFI